jgi:cell division septation protein DedD
VVNRRQTLRRLLILPPVRVSLGDFSQELLFDLSEGGLSVYGRLASLGRRNFPVKFRLPGDETPITTRGEVAWTARNRTGVKFVDLPQASRLQLKYWMATKLPAAPPYPADSKISSRRRMFRSSLTDPVAGWSANHLRKAALILPIVASVVLIGLAWSHARLKSAQEQKNKAEKASAGLLEAGEAATEDHVPSGQASAGTSVARNGVSPTATSNSAATRGFVLQVAALGRERNAEDLSSSLKKKGFPVIVSRSPTDALYRVVVGPYPDVSSAIRVRNQLKAQDIDGFVRPWTAQ